MDDKQLQALIDGMGAQSQLERSRTQMTLGQLIGYLEELEPDRLIEGMGELMSYRGYYSDLAFNPYAPFDFSDAENPLRAPVRTVSEILAECKAAMGNVFEGYKGGEFQMGARTPLWIATYGGTGPRLMALDVSCHPIQTVTEDEPD